MKPWVPPFPAHKRHCGALNVNCPEGWLWWFQRSPDFPVINTVADGVRSSSNTLLDVLLLSFDLGHDGDQGCSKLGYNPDHAFVFQGEAALRIQDVQGVTGEVIGFGDGQFEVRVDGGGSLVKVSGEVLSQAIMDAHRAGKDPLEVFGYHPRT